MDIPKIIKEHHQAMIDKGFYICPDCNGTGEGISSSISAFDVYTPDCKSCSGSGIEQNKDTRILVAMIAGELIGEALNAHKSKKFSDWEGFKTFIKEDFESGFESCIKDTLGDEIADVHLRLFDLCGYKNWVLVEPHGISDKNYSNIPVSIFWITEEILKIAHDASYIHVVINSLHWFCKHHNIPIEKHIYAKMAYNKSRPHKHGKEY